MNYFYELLREIGFVKRIFPLDTDLISTFHERSSGRVSTVSTFMHHVWFSEKQYSPFYAFGWKKGRRNLVTSLDTIKMFKKDFTLTCTIADLFWCALQTSKNTCEVVQSL